jgi:hypothetical protein
MSVPLCVLMNGGMQIDVEMRVCRVWCRVGTSYTGVQNVDVEDVKKKKRTAKILNVELK